MKKLNLQDKIPRIRYLIPAFLLILFVLILLGLRFSGPKPSRTWSEIKKSGELRIFTSADSEFHGLQRCISPLDLEFALLAAFAQEEKLTLRIEYSENFLSLEKNFHADHSDILAHNLSITDRRKKKYRFSDSFFTTREYLVTYRGAPPQRKKPKIAIQSGTSYERQIPELKKRYPQAEFFLVPDEVEDLLCQVGFRKYDMTVTDSNYLKAYLQYQQDVQPLCVLGESNQIAWALPPDAEELQGKLNDFLKRRLGEIIQTKSTGDLKQIKRRQILRVLTRNSPTNYFLHGEQTRGFEYELTRRFAKSQNLQVVLVTPPRHELLIPYLKQGLGDVIAATWSITEERKNKEGVVFCRPYASTHEIFVTGDRGPAIRNLRELAGKTVTVRKGGSYDETLRKFQRDGLSLKIAYVQPEVESAEILDQIAEKQADLTLIDALLYQNALLNGRDHVRALFRLNKVQQYAWMVRRENPKLKEAIDHFLEQEVKTPGFASLYEQYFGTGTMKKKIDPPVNLTEKRISKYDALIKRLSPPYSFDWRLISAQVCQESNFDPTAHAFDGGMGLMQLMPFTALEMHCRNPYDPAENLKAGIGYLSRQRDRLPKCVREVRNRECFALASYNGGYGHVLDARRLASELGKDPNLWFDNVESAMKLLSHKKYYSRFKYGYCQSGIITNYVREIMERYDDYSRQIPK